jgi:hypothetical protein
MKRGYRKLIWVAGALLIVLAGLELFCRLYLGLGDPPLLRTDPEIEYMFIGPRTYHRFGNTVTYNTYSMRTHEFDARRKDATEIRVMVCGDSVINGGSLTDQSQLVTTRLEEHLKAELHRPAVVMNISAGSWGPPNFYAYVKRYGFFEADVLVIVVSSHDYADSPTFDPLVGVNPDFPDKTPMFALSEAIMRYLPRYVPHWGAAGAGGGGAPETMGPSQGQIDQAMSAMRSLIVMAQGKGIPVIVAQNLEQYEYGTPETEGHRMLREASDELRVDRIELGPMFEAEMKAGRTVYRDSIHPNVLGHEIMEKAIYPEVLKALRK